MTSLVNRSRVLRVEFYGWLSGRLLVRIARIALKAGDVVTIYRVREIVQRGYDVGWNPNDANDGKLVPGRKLY